MSRVGKKQINIPNGVKVTNEGDFVKIVGNKSDLSVPFSKRLDIAIDGNVLKLSPKSKDSKVSSDWGLTRSLIQSAITGVSDGYKVNLELRGVGYRSSVSGSNLTLSLAYSHDIILPIPSSIGVKIEKSVNIVLSGCNIQELMLFAKKIRSYRPPEPYKGKGIFILGREYNIRKEGKRK